MDKQAVVPALQLLLADFSDEERSKLFSMAFPNGFVLLRSQ